MPLLRQLSDGTKFNVPSLGITGTLLKINECRAHVRLDGGTRNVRINDDTSFIATNSKTADWSPSVEVTVLPADFIPTKTERPNKNQRITTMASATQSEQKVTKKVSGEKAAPKATKKAAKKKDTAPKEQTPCKCGCGEMTSSDFKQGHDARFHGRCKKLKDGRLTMAELKKDKEKPVASYAYKYYEKGHVE